MPLGRGGSRSRKCRPSVVHCAERYACPTQPAVAAFYCDQCQTNQCQSCEFHLHKVEKNGRHLFEFHDRHAIVPPSADQICEQFKSGGCDPRNVADVVCSSCNQRRYCFDCDTKVHRGRQMSSHRRAPLSLADFQPPPPLKGLNELVERLSPPPLFDCTSGAVCSGIDGGTSLRNSFDGEGDELFESLPMTENFSENCHPNVASVSNFVKSNVTLTKSSSCRADSVAVLQNNDASDYTSAVDFVSNPPPVSSVMVSTAANSTELPPKSFMLLDQNARLMINTVEDFKSRLHCRAKAGVHTVSVLGTIGCGKSYLLNRTFFGGANVFHTKPTADGSSVLSGIHAAFDSARNIILLDVESASDVGDDQCERKLLKMVFSLSDVVIIHVKMERLQGSIFQFLSPDVDQFSAPCCNTTSTTNVEKSEPAVIVFHETQHSDVLSDDDGKQLLEQQLSDLGLPRSAVGCVRYVGTQTVQPPSDFRQLLSTVEKLLSDGAARIVRTPSEFYAQLQTISNSFTKEVVDSIVTDHTDAAVQPSFAACSSKCVCCSASCILPATHCDIGASHSADRQKPCKYTEQFENRVLLCLGCWKQGKEVVLQRKSWESTDSSWYSRAVSAWTGYALECVNCGIVYRGTESWFGSTGGGADANSVAAAEKSSIVRTAVRHVWPEDADSLQSASTAAAGSTFFTARHVIDKVSSVSEALVGLGAEPTKKVTNWITDRIAPSNWVPNWQLTNCHRCGVAFDTSTPIHHCRCCGQGFCDRCSSRRRPLPELNWGTSPVRVCDKCFDKPAPGCPPGGENGTSVTANDVIPRFVGETIGSTVGALASAVKVTLLDAARPANWIPDEEITECAVCSTPFSSACRLHHCRACGHGICDSCSPHRRPVPTHGWHEPVRVCTPCYDGVNESS